MLYLLIVSLIWAFSFGLIKDNLSSLDSNFVAFLRLLISFLVFIPFLRIKKIKLEFIWKLILLGSVQFGLMYSAYIYAFKFLDAYEVVLFTILTPIYINAINDSMKKKFHLTYLLTAILSILGALIIVNHEITSQNIIYGFLLIQFSNLCFAFGQVYYKNIMTELENVKDRDIFALPYLGAVGITFLISLFAVEINKVTITTSQIFTLLYLGVIASGLGFFLWNNGVRKTNIGTVAIFNNLKIPLGILVSVLFFGEVVKIQNLIIGGLILITALVINEYQLNKRILYKTMKERNK